MTSSEHVENVLIFSEEFLPFYTGHGIYQIKLHPYLNKHGFRYTVLTPRRLADSPKREFMNGMEVYRIESGGRWKFARFYLGAICYMWRMRRSYRVIHVNTFYDRFFLLSMAARLLRKKLVLQLALFGSDDPQTFIRTFRFGALRFLVVRGLVNMFCPISTPLEQACLNAGVPRRKVRKIFQGVDVSRFKPSVDADQKAKSREVLGLPAAGGIAIFVGAIIHRKGLDILIAAWARLQASHPQATLLLVGPNQFGTDDENETALNAYVSELRAAAESQNLNVIWAGKTNLVEEYMAASDMFVFPSRQEGFPNVIVEAMACGLPCILTPMDGAAMDTVIPGETGYIVNGEIELAARMSELLADKERAVQMGQRGRESAVKRFELDSIAAQYARLYGSVSSGSEPENSPGQQATQ